METLEIHPLENLSGIVYRLKKEGFGEALKVKNGSVISGDGKLFQSDKIMYNYLFDGLPSNQTDYLVLLGIKGVDGRKGYLISYFSEAEELLFKRPEKPGLAA